VKEGCGIYMGIFKMAGAYSSPTYQTIGVVRGEGESQSNEKVELWSLDLLAYHTM
jgi:hypothetical protein